MNLRKKLFTIIKKAELLKIAVIRRVS